MTEDNEDLPSVSDEAVKLVESLSAWATGAAHQAAEAPAPPVSGRDCCGGECTARVCAVCPVCRVASFVDALSPEVLQKGADLLGMIAASLQAAANDRYSAGGGPGTGGAGTRGGAGRGEQSEGAPVDIPVDEGDGEVSADQDGSSDADPDGPARSAQHKTDDGVGEEES